MRRWNRRWVRIIVLMTTWSFATAQLSGCVAGNYGLVRTVSDWNLKMSLLPRVLVYIGLLIVPVYILSILFDVILNNTLEFWTDSALVHVKNETFKKDGYRVFVAHSRDPLRKSVFTTFDKAGAVQSVSELRETERGTVELFLNGEKKAEMNSISEGLTGITTIQGQNREQVIVHSADLTQPSQNRASILANLRAKLKGETLVSSIH